MADQDPPEDPNDRSILDPGGPTDQDDASSDPSNREGSGDKSDSQMSSSATAAGSETEEGDSASETDPSGGDVLHFDDDNLGENLRNASEEELDNASFGIIRVDDEGSVEFFNQYEAELSGMDPEEVRGRNFFTQVAPCTNNRLFRGRFKKGVRRGELDETFTYTYTYKMRPTLVDVHLFRDEAGNNWITVQKY